MKQRQLKQTLRWATELPFCWLVSRATLRTAPELPTAAATRPVSVSRFSRFRSARISAAALVTQRPMSFFLAALLMIRSNSAGASGFSRIGDTGARLRMASKNRRRTVFRERAVGPWPFHRARLRRRTSPCVRPNSLAQGLLGRHIGHRAHCRTWGGQVRVSGSGFRCPRWAWLMWCVFSPVRSPESCMRPALSHEILAGLMSR